MHFVCLLVVVVPSNRMHLPYSAKRPNTQPSAPTLCAASYELQHSPTLALHVCALTCTLLESAADCNTTRTDSNRQGRLHLLNACKYIRLWGRLMFSVCTDVLLESSVTPSFVLHRRPSQSAHTQVKSQLQSIVWGHFNECWLDLQIHNIYWIQSVQIRTTRAPWCCSLDSNICYWRAEQCWLSSSFSTHWWLCRLLFLGNVLQCEGSGNQTFGWVELQAFFFFKAFSLIECT